MATSRRYKPQNSSEWTEETDWHTVVVFGKRAETLNTQLNKGSKVFVVGYNKTRTWEDKHGSKHYTTDVMADRVLIMATPEGHNYGSKAAQEFDAYRTGEEPAQPQLSADFDGDDDIPF